MPRVFAILLPSLWQFLHRVQSIEGGKVPHYHDTLQGRKRLQGIVMAITSVRQTIQFEQQSPV